MKAALLLMLALNTWTVYTRYTIPLEPQEVTLNSISISLSSNPEEQQARLLQFPFMVLILRDGALCSSCLVKPTWAITAAHCIIGDMGDAVLVAGNVDYTSYLSLKFYAPEYIDKDRFFLQERRIINAFRHPKYNKKRYFYNAGVLQMGDPFSPTYARPAPISRRKMDGLMLCTVLGFGIKDKKYVLRYAMDRFGGEPNVCRNFLYEKVPPPLLCSASKKPFMSPGDLGSPLICNNEVWGIATFFTSSKPEIPSINANYESYYVELYHFLPWIDELTENSSTVVIENIFPLTLLIIFLRNFVCICKI